jgi:hypothetical protein
MTDQDSGLGPAFILGKKFLGNNLHLNILEHYVQKHFPSKLQQKHIYIWWNAYASFIFFWGTRMIHFLQATSACEADILTTAGIPLLVPQFEWIF